MNTLQSPRTGRALKLDSDGQFWSTADGTEQFPIENGVVSFLKKSDSFYEGAYLNRVKFVPGERSLFGRLVLWSINGGYITTVKRTFPQSSTLVELGCAAGVDYFGLRYKMIGVDLSKQSLAGLNNYQLALQVDATGLPLADSSVDGIISSYFWEHIPPLVKDIMLAEFHRVLKPGGKIVFLYDVETKNSLLGRLKVRDINLYNRLFLDGDGHLGYETPHDNQQRFERNNFSVKSHFGMERTWFQSNSVFTKLKALTGGLGLIGKIGFYLSSGILTRPYIFFLRVFDATLGKFFPLHKSRIIRTVAFKQ